MHPDNQITMLTTEGLLMHIPAPLHCSAKHPDSAIDVFNFAKEDLRKRHYDYAVTMFTEFIHLTGDPIGYEYRIQANNNLEDWPWVLDDYNKLIAMDPFTERHWFNRGGFRLDSGDFEGAIADFNRALELKPRHIKTYELRGSAYAGLNQLSAAFEDYNKAWQMNPKRPDAIVKRGIAKVLHGDESGALEDYALAIQIKPGDEMAQLNMGILLQSHERYAEALLHFLRASKINRINSFTYIKRAECHYALCNFHKAEKDLCTAIRQADGKDIESFFNRALVRCTLKKYNPALEDVNKVIQMDCFFPQAVVLRDNILSLLTKIKDKRKK